jgi:hypothetical protein
MLRPWLLCVHAAVALFQSGPGGIQASAGNGDHFRLAGAPQRPGAQCAVCGHAGGAGDGRSRDAAGAGNHAASPGAAAEIAGEASEEASAASRCRGSTATGDAMPSGLRQLRRPDEILLVPRTRSSRISCRAFDRELRVQRGTRIIELLVVLDSEVRKQGCRTNDANFGIGPLN